MRKETRKVTRREGRKEQIIRRKKISLVMQALGILFMIIGFIFLFVGANQADYLAEIQSTSNAWIEPIIKCVAMFLIGGGLIMFPKVVFKISAF